MLDCVQNNIVQLVHTIEKKVSLSGLPISKSTPSGHPTFSLVLQLDQLARQ